MWPWSWSPGCGTSVSRPPCVNKCGLGLGAPVAAPQSQDHLVSTLHLMLVSPCNALVSCSAPRSLPQQMLLTYQVTGWRTLPRRVDWAELPVDSSVTPGNDSVRRSLERPSVFAAQHSPCTSTMLSRNGVTTTKTMARICSSRTGTKTSQWHFTYSPQKSATLSVWLSELVPVLIPPVIVTGLPIHLMLSSCTSDSVFADHCMRILTYLLN